MISITKRNDIPASLAAQRSYSEDDVVQALLEDSHNKCYICEISAPTSINVEHFTEHRGVAGLKYDWFNLMYACTHCNSTKNDLFRKVPSDIIKCTDPQQHPDLWIEYRIDISQDLRAVARITQNPLENAPAYQQQIDNTLRLLNAVYNGSGSPIRNQEATNLLYKVVKATKDFQQLLFQYLTCKEPRKKLQLRIKIKNELDVSSEFTAFKRWIVRDLGQEQEFS